MFRFELKYSRFRQLARLCIYNDDDVRCKHLNTSYFLILETHSVLLFLEALKENK